MALHASPDKMHLDEPDSDLSSSPISSAPISPRQNGLADTIQVASRLLSIIPGGVAAAAANPATAAQPHVTATPSSTTASTTPAPPKRSRKKKELGPDGKPIDDGKPKPTKPRKPKDKTTTNGTSTAAGASSSRKKVKVEDKSNDSASSRQPSIAATVTRYPSVTAMSTAPPPPPPLASTPIPRPATSGQKYDPVRGMTMEYARPPPASLAVPTPPPQINRASASPSIASLIDPLVVTSATLPSSLQSPQNIISQPFADSSPPQPSANPTPQVQASPSPTLSRTMPISAHDNAMDLDKSPSGKIASKADMKATTSSAAVTPKAILARSSPPAPKGTGSGLLSSSDLFGGGPSAGDGAERKGVNIDIHIKLDPNGGNHINVAQEIIKKYGRDAINPRAAAHRERLLQVMAAANKIEGASADDMSIDLMSDMGDDSNVEMGGMDDGSAADGDKPRKRRKKTEEYDLDDEFIDDTELAWQQQAAVAKDGFFVYSGPLIPEGETARVEAANAGARGRGGRRGGRAKAAAVTTTHASLAEKKEPAATASSAGARGRGRVRAPAAPRKPRPTKAEKEKLDAEKAASASTAPVPPPLAPPPAQVAATESAISAT